MNNFIILTFFKNKLKNVIKKHKSFKSDFILAINNFINDTNKKKYISDYGLYKIRIGIKSDNIGKSGGYRTLILLHRNGIYFPISIYFKGEKESLSISEIKRDLFLAKYEIEKNEY